MSSSGRQVYFNPSAHPKAVPPSAPTELVHAFHRKLPGYTPTRLVSLDGLAKELCVDAVYLKEESNRIGVPSFKILGASWGTFRAVARKLQLPLDCELAEVKEAAKHSPTTLYAATAGNHGRAVARVGRLLELLVEIFVPTGMHPDTMRLITDEGAHLTIVSGNYDDAVRTSYEESQKSGAILIQDMAWEGYEEIPNWIVEGYSTMLREADAQLPAHRTPTHVLTPVGVGSLAQAVVTHYASPTRPSSPTIITVEPDTAACLHNALTTGMSTTIETQPTILAGLNCGTVSRTAWPLLRTAVSVAVTVSDHEAHTACTYLSSHNVDAGPCGGATVAALRRLALSSADRHAAGLDERSVLVLLCTEGARVYDYPAQA